MVILPKKKVHSNLTIDSQFSYAGYYAHQCSDELLIGMRIIEMASVTSLQK